VKAEVLQQDYSSHTSLNSTNSSYQHPFVLKEDFSGLSNGHQGATPLIDCMEVDKYILIKINDKADVLGRD